MLTLLEQSILKTLAYFDEVDFPLTSEEVFHYLWNPPQTSLLEVKELLQTMENAQLIERLDAFFVLPKRKEIVQKRQEKVVYTEKLLKKALRAIRFIRFVPFLRAIFVCNSIASETATLKSDIDFFIIAKTKHIWTVRFFTNIILFCLGVRRHGKKIAERICLSFYIDEEHLNLSSLRILPDDIHFIYWLKQMIPLFDTHNVFKEFNKTNIWTKEYLLYYDTARELFASNEENFFLPHLSHSRLSLFLQTVLEKIANKRRGEWLENCLKKIQKYKMKSSVKNSEGTDRGVFISDGVIKLHEYDLRRMYRENWLKKIKNIQVNVL